MSRYQNKYEHLKNKMDQTMLQLNQAKSVGMQRGYNGANEYSPLRQSNSPKRGMGSHYGGGNTDLPVERKLNFTNERSPKSNRKRSGSSNLRNKGKVTFNQDLGMSNARTNATNFNDLLGQIEALQRERDHYANEAYLEKQKNSELEKEFHTLRELIALAQRPPGLEENLILKSQYQTERDLRIQAESELSRTRQQLTDMMQGSHRDVSNLKKALTDMQVLNNKNLQTIYEKGDQNLS